MPSGAARRLVCCLLALVFGWLAAPTAATAASSVHPVVSYTYDALTYEASGGLDTTTERGPPRTHGHAVTAYDAVGLRSDGASARPHRATPSATYDYDHPAPLVRTARVAPAAGGDAQGDRGTLTALRRSDVATRATPPDARETLRGDKPNL